MSFRFWKRIKIAPGLTLNLSKSGASLSFGSRGAKYTVGSRGKRATVGIPGTGLFYTAKTPRKKPVSGVSRSSDAAKIPSAGTEDRLSLGFFEKLATPDDEKALVEGCRELVRGDEEKAFASLRQAVHLADGAYLAGVLALKKERMQEAEEYLTSAVEKHDRLGTSFSKYGIVASLSLPITAEISAVVGSDLRGALLALVEVYQHLARWQDARLCLERLRQLEPDDVVVKLSLAELLLEAEPDDQNTCRNVVQLTDGIGNETPIHTALLLYKARALHGLGLLDAARSTLTEALKRKRDRPDDLLHAVRYERARLYEESGWKSRARTEFEKLYAEAPDYEDVAKRLGL